MSTASNIFCTKDLANINAFEESLNVIIGRIIQYFFRRSNLYYLTTLHNGDAVTNTHCFI